MKGPAGYGRYDDDPGHVGCPWAKSDMSPCVARDGMTCVSDGDRSPQVCVGCGHPPAFLLADLAEDYPPARRVRTANPRAVANRLRDLVRAATEPPGAGR